MFNPNPRLPFAVALSLVAGCYSGLNRGPDAGLGGDAGLDGDDDDDDGEGGDDDDDDSHPDDPAAQACEDGVVTSSAAPIRRLTRQYYRNTIVDVLGEDEGLDEALTRLATQVDGKAGAFASTTSAVDTELARNYLLLAEDVAALHVGNGLTEDLTCDWAQQACAETLLDTTGRRLHRGPLDATRRQAYLDLYTTTRDDLGPQSAMETLLTALLASPGFLYIDERALDTDGVEPLVQLSSWGFAARLAYFLWESAPDDELLDTAEDGSLLEPAVREAQIARMLADPRFERTISSFHTQLMEVNEPLFADEHPEMRQEVEAFANHVFAERGASLTELLTASYTFGDAELAAIYGATPPTVPFGRIELDPAERSGLLTQSGFLAHTGDIFPTVHRGVLVRRNFLCDPLADPPPIELDPQVDRLETEPCAGCHQFTDTIGQGFANYDALGRFVTENEAGPIDAGGEVVEISEGTPFGEFDGAIELGQRLAESERVKTCFAMQWARYATGRLGTKDDKCTMEGLSNIVVETDGDLSELVVGLANSEWFGSRATSDFQ